MSKNYANVVVRCSANNKEKQEECRFSEVKNGDCTYKSNLNGTILCLNSESSTVAFGRLGL